MVINQDFVDKVLFRAKEIFRFRGYLKYYPGRELAEEKSLVFAKREQFMDYIGTNVLWAAEYYVICQRRYMVSFRLKEELMQYQMNSSGKFTLVDYIDRSLDYGKIPIKVNREELIKELKYLIKVLSRPKGQKKGA